MTESPPQTPQPTGIRAWFQRSALARLLLLAGLAVFLQLPVAMISSTLGARQSLRDEAVSEVSGKWGRSQTLRGPILVLPFVERSTQTDAHNRTTSVTTTRYARFLPRDLQVSGQADTEVRYRGIFRVPVYRGRLVLTGEFERPDLSVGSLRAEDIMWTRAYLTVHVTDPRAIGNAAVLQWDGLELPFQPSAGEGEQRQGGIHVPLDEKRAQGPHRFRIELDLNGSLGLAFAPTARRTRVELKSDWGAPSFQGDWLPRSRNITAQGFRASWDVSALGRDYPQAWVSSPGMDSALHATSFGVALLTPVDPYRMSERSIKYSVLFLALTFLTLWLFEVRSGLRIHPIQSLLLGSALCLFFLLELALSEHLGFHLAYLVAASAVVLLVTVYCIFVLRRRWRSLVTGGVVAAVYSYLYVVLLSENSALLFGSLALFVALALVMFLTRHTNWSQLEVEGNDG